MLQELFIPRFEWLIGGSRIGGSYNTYYGSQTERPEEAAWGQRVFNYAIYIEKIDENEYLRAAVWSGLRTLGGCPEEDVAREVFPCEEDSLPQVKAWVTAQRDAFFAAV